MITSKISKTSLVKNKNIFSCIKDRINAGPLGATVIVPHVCNNVNGFGAGFAGQVASNYPIVKNNFHLLGNRAKLGHTQFIIADINNTYKHTIVFANMIAQNGIISSKNNRPLNYYSLCQCMDLVSHYIKSSRDKYENTIEIHAPKFGSGLAGGNWSFINELITDIWADFPVFIYTQK